MSNATSVKKYRTRTIGYNLLKPWRFLNSTQLGNTSEPGVRLHLQLARTIKSIWYHSYSIGDWIDKEYVAGSFGSRNNINNHGSYSTGNENTIDIIYHGLLVLP